MDYHYNTPEKAKKVFLTHKGEPPLRLTSVSQEQNRRGGHKSLSLSLMRNDTLRLPPVSNIEQKELLTIIAKNLPRSLTRQESEEVRRKTNPEALYESLNKHTIKQLLKWDDAIVFYEKDLDRSGGMMLTVVEWSSNKAVLQLRLLDGKVLWRSATCPRKDLLRFLEGLEQSNRIEQAITNQELSASDFRDDADLVRQVKEINDLSEQMGGKRFAKLVCINGEVIN